MTKPPQVWIQSGERLTRRSELNRALALCGPALLWITTLLLLPFCALMAMSFASRGPYGEILLPATLENYSRFLGLDAESWNSVYLEIVFRSLSVAAITTLICALLAFPLAFFIAGQPKPRKNVMLILLMIPFWSNLLIRTYAWQYLLAPTGALSKIAQWAGIVPPETGLYPSFFAVCIGLVCDYLPYLVLPLYSSVEKLNWSLVEAASDLGANRAQVFRHAILPQIVPGLAAGCIFVFIPATGQFVIPDLLGGAKTALLGNILAQQFGQSRDWPFGSAVAMFGMAMLLLGLWYYAKVAGKKGEDLAL